MYERALREDQTEGRIAREIEKRTAKLPSDAFLWSAIGAICGSIVLRAIGRRSAGNFVGEWVPTLLILGVYNKLVKLHGQGQRF